MFESLLTTVGKYDFITVENVEFTLRTAPNILEDPTDANCNYCN
jgi:hypothetical protein